MKKYITNIYGHYEFSTAQNAQHSVTSIAKNLGYQEIALGAFDPSRETEDEMKKRISGSLTITSQDNTNSFVIVQIPSWRGVLYDKLLLAALREKVRYIVLFIQDVPPLMFATDVLDVHLEIYNSSDLLIVPSVQMQTFLVNNGVTVPSVIQELWDHPNPACQLSNPILKKECFFIGDIKRFPFVKNWNSEIPLKVYSEGSINNNSGNIQLHPQILPQDLVLKMSKGGFGLVWSEGREKIYSEMNASYKFSTYLASGIPVIVRKGSSREQFVIKNKVGFVACNIEEVENIINNVSNEMYQELIENIKDISDLIFDGYFTKNLLLEVERRLFLEK